MQDGIAFGGAQGFRQKDKIKEADMAWQEEYRSKIMSADKALDMIQSGNRIVIQHAAGEPSYLVQVLLEKKEQYRNVEIVHQVSLGPCDYCGPEMEPFFHHNAIFLGKGARRAVAEGRADYIPCFNFEIPRLFKDGYLPVDVALVQVAPPDDAGRCSLGISIDYTLGAAKNAKYVIAQVNRHMPRTFGESTLHVSEIAAFVEHDAPLLELKPGAIGDVEKAIGQNCAKLIQDGDTLQLGIGNIPDAVLYSLKDKKDLGIHSEMISDGVVALAEAGIITNAKKTIDKGKFVIAFLMGTRRLYDYVHENPAIEMRPYNYVTHPMTIMQHDNIVSINSCVQVDFSGQVCAEMVGSRQISGVGGQVDFIRGASMAKNGRAIIAMPSTTTDGSISKIVPDLDEGACVTTSRNDVDFVVTEYGIARLRGKNLRQRAKILIGIAHPDFRKDLTEAFEKRFKCQWEDVSV